MIEVEPGEEVTLETRDAMDLQIGPRTTPPRENCGNADVKQLTRGSKLYVPVAVDGALYSVGDGHFAQGDAECCGTGWSSR